MPTLKSSIVIINCSTREQTTLALVSALAHSSLPVTVIDCESTDGSVAFFRKLQKRLDFELVERPLARHGITLDRLFRATDRDALLLLDSDAEILRDDVVPKMIEALGSDTYGSGFLHRGQWLSANHLVAGEIGYYAPRMWIPCVLLAVEPIRAALAAGLSFAASVRCNEVPQLPWLARLLYLRFRVPGIARMRLDWLGGTRNRHFGQRPHYVYYDTGAELHQRLVEDRGLAFAALPDGIWPLAVSHCHGVTRRKLGWRMRNAADVDGTRREAVKRIESIYGIAVPELNSRGD